MYHFGTNNDIMIRITFSALFFYSIGMFLHGLLPITLKSSQLAGKIINYIYTAGFLMYLFGFLAVWDYYTILREEWILVIFSIPFWIAGIYIVKKNFF